MAARAVRLLGDPILRERSRAVPDPADAAVARQLGDLRDTLAEFRARHGFGRAISAPQIGLSWRVIAIDLGRGPSLILDPRITWRSEATMTLWDDCMSFPDLMVRLARHRSISVTYTDERGETRAWEKLDPAAAELLQHEIDHLDGILAIDRALDRDSLVLRPVFEARRAELAALVDYVIVPTIPVPGSGTPMGTTG